MAVRHRHCLRSLLIALVMVVSACSSDGPAPAAAGAAAQQAPAPPPAPPPPPPPPPPPTPEERLRAELKAWEGTPYVENGASRKGIDNDSFVRAVFHGALGVDLPAKRDDQYRTGKLVNQEALASGDLIFFEGEGIGPFRAKWVGLYIGRGEFAIARKEEGVVIARIADAKWRRMYKTARRISLDPNATPPTFNAADYGSNRESLLKDIAKAWSGTLYAENGTTFEGIGNDEFVRSVYEAVHETELPGTPKQWAGMGVSVKRDALEPGDIIIYEPPGLGRVLSFRHAGIYLGDGEFVHAAKGQAVMVSKVKEAPWGESYKGARRIDPAGLDRAAAAPALPAPTHVVTETERKLREAIEPWLGTPYKIGGTSKSGVDCSAFVRAVFDAAFGTSLPRTAEEQEGLGAKVDRKDLQSGDLVFFRTKGMGPFFRSRHVGVYLGGGEFAQASGRNGVNITRLNHPYWGKKYATARRLVAAPLDSQ